MKTFMIKYMSALIFSFVSNETSVLNHFCTYIIPVYSIELELHARS
jgi:hypothetical protein